MTREEIFKKLYDEDEVYRSPIESGSALLEVTKGCSWGKCLFCDFIRDKKELLPPERIEEKIELLSKVIDGNERLYFLGCNPFCLDSGILMYIMDLVHRNLPSVRTVSMYARADDVNRKSDEELIMLNRAGIRELHIGIESGSDRILKFHNKGETAEELKTAFDRLDRFGYFYHVTVIPGLGGRKLSHEHALMTAKLLSSINPVSIWCIMLKLWPGTPLYSIWERGGFDQMTPGEVLLEEREMLTLMDMKNPCLYTDSTVLNKYTILGELPEQKDILIKSIDKLLSEEDVLNKKHN